MCCSVGGWRCCSRSAGPGRLVFVCEGGPLGRVTVPESWTDRGPAPAGHRLSVEALVELDTLLTVLEQR